MITKGTLHFFGDSWISDAGELIEQKLKKSLQTIPQLVGDILQVPVKNYARCGSSQMEMIYELSKHELKPGDQAILALTAPSRKFTLDDNNEVNKRIPGIEKSVINDYNDSWQSACACYMFYKLCTDTKIQPWLFSTFNVSWWPEVDNTLWHKIPDEVWILPKKTCVLATHFDSLWFGQFEQYRNTDFSNWLTTQNECVKKYIHPGIQHPNQEGRKLIAQMISQRLAVQPI